MTMAACAQCFKLFESVEGWKLCQECKMADDATMVYSNSSHYCKYCEVEAVRLNNTICAKCEKNCEKYGTPQVCVYCGVQGAFIGRKCRRCSTDYKKHGEPTKCTKCNARAVFGGGEMSKYQMCRKCKIQYKLSKKRNYATMNNSTTWKEPINCSDESSLSLTDSGPEVMTKDRDYRLLLPQTLPKTVSNKFSPDNKTNGHAKIAKKTTYSNSDQEQSSGKEDSPKTRYKSFDNRVNSLHRQLMKNFPNDIFIDKKSSSSSGETKKRTSTPDSVVVVKDVPKPLSSSLPRLPDIGTRQSPSLSEKAKMGSSPLSLPTVNDTNIVELTNLREQIQSLKKQLAKKDSMLLEKDKQISCIKVEHIQELRDARTKMKEKDAEYHQVVERLQLKNSEFARKISQLSKGKM